MTNTQHINGAETMTNADILNAIETSEYKLPAAKTTAPAKPYCRSVEDRSEEAKLAEWETFTP